MSSHQAHVLARDDPTDRELVRLLGQLDDLLERLGAAESTWSDWLAAVARLSRQRPKHRALLGNSADRLARAAEPARCFRAVLAGSQRTPRGGHPRMSVPRWWRCWRTRGSQRRPRRGRRRRARAAALRTVDLLGPAPADRETRIMITPPSEAATKPDLIPGLLRARHERGPDQLCTRRCKRLAWDGRACATRQCGDSGRSCLVAMDLAGPKLRTGPIQPGPRVIRLRPGRDALGRVVTPARAWLTAAEDPAPAPEPGMPTLPVPGDWLSRRRARDVVPLRHDTRGAKRQVILVLPDSAGESSQPPKRPLISPPTPCCMSTADR